MKAIVLLSALILAANLAHANDLQARYGLTIEDHDLDRTVAPQVARPDRPVQMWDVAPQNEEPCLAAVEQALGVYPATFVKALVRRLVLAGDIYAWGRSVGSAQAPGLVAINCSRPVEGTPYITANTHGMVAAKVTDIGLPNWTLWKAANRPGFKYGDLDAFKAALHDPDAWTLTRRLNQEGFVNGFGLVGEENDFETYAEQAFGHGAEFASLVRQYPPMQQKLRILLDTYLALAPSLRDYFDQTGLANAAGLGLSPDAAAAQAQPTAAR